MSLFEMKNERWDMNQYEVLKRTMAEASSTLDKLQPTRSGALLNYEVIQKLLNNLQEEVQQLEADLDEEDPWDV
jgi:predicted  nucleic acid-binding Zn-ribbon protein